MKGAQVLNRYVCGRHSGGKAQSVVVSRDEIGSITNVTVVLGVSDDRQKFAYLFAKSV